jgi:ABC-type dipeptide/oligopeptide/nickel transport system permease component
MARRLIFRVLWLILTVLGVAVAVFILQYVVPGDPARSLMPRAANAQAIAQIRAQLRLDDPIYVQFGHYFAGLLHGDLGQSYVQREPVAKLIMTRLPMTGVLAATGVAMAVVVGMLLGMAVALTQIGRRGVPLVNMVFLSIPSFVLGLFLLMVLGFRLHIFPVTGGAGLLQLFLPALTLGLGDVPYYAQIVSEEMTQSLASPYVRTAVAKGLPNRRIVLDHSLRNVFPPVVTMLGIDLGVYLSGVIVVEAVFGWPGMGLLAVQSLNQLDRPVVLGCALVAAVSVGLFNFLADIVRMVIDPRTRQETP